jgi:uncharacterized protein (TIGR03067 family)
MTRFVYMALVAGMLLAADKNKEEAKKDRELLQGIWRPTSAESRGQVLKAATDSVTILEGDAFAVKKGDVVQVKGTFKIDASKSPRHIDLTVTGGQVESDKGKVVRGIYQVDGNMLKWCTAEAGEETRPTEFATKEGTKISLMTFKKEKRRRLR